MTDRRLRFRDHFALSNLPWFDQNSEGRLILSDPSIGKILDMHTHLALSYGPWGAIDLWQLHEQTRHYLPMARPLDLNVYANQNMTDSDLSTMKQDLAFKTFTRKGLRITHTAANLCREMDEMGISSSVLLAVDFPVLSRNSELYVEVEHKKPERLIAFGSVHPYTRDLANKLKDLKSLGIHGVKIHPGCQLIAPDHPRCMILYRECAKLSLPIFFHCGPVGIEPAMSRYLSQLKHYWKAIAENPETIFILGHSGALQVDLAIDLAQTYSNVYLELASQCYTGVKKILKQVQGNKILFGSDWPFYHQALPLAKVLMLTEGAPELRHDILWQNGANLLGINKIS